MRAFVSLFILLGLAPLCARAADPPAIDALRSTLAAEARHAADAWALSHALLAFGPDFELESTSTILAGLESLAIPDSGGGAHYDLFGAGGVMGEMHPHLVFKTLAGEGLEPELCGKLARSVHFPVPESAEEWNDTAWLIEALARTSGSGPGLKPDRVDPGLPVLAGGMLLQLEAADRVTAAGIDESGVLERPKGGGDPSESGIWAYTCGGQHLFQAVLVAYEERVLSAADKPRLDAMMDLFLRRVKGEASFRDAEEQAAIAAGVNPLLAAHNAMVQVLKLEGHALETLARARDAGIGDPATLRAAATDIRNDIESRLAAFRGVLDLAKLMPSVRAGDPSTWRKWFGDGCHALHGLSLWPDLPPAVAK